MSSTTILLLIIIAILAGGTVGDILGGIGVMVIVGAVFFILGWIAILLFVINPTLLLIIVGGLVILGLVLYIPKLTVKLSKDAVDKRLNTVKNNQKINKNDLKILIDSYEKSLKEITDNPQQNEYALSNCADKFMGNFNLGSTLHGLLFDLHYLYIYYHQKIPAYSVWHSKVIPVSSIRTKVVDYPEAYGEKIQLDHKKVTIILQPDKDGSELEVLENNKHVYKLRIHTETHNDYDYSNPYSGSYDTTTYHIDLFKPGNWLMEIHNFMVDYKNEKVQLAHDSLLLKKGDFSSSR